MRWVSAAAVLMALPAHAQDFYTLRGHGGPIMDIAVSSSDRIATASFDNSVGLWQADTPVWYDGHDAAVNVTAFWSDDVILSGGDDFQILVWRDPVTPQLLGRHKGKVMSLATSYAAGRVASASWDGTIGLWPLAADGSAVVDSPPLFLTGHRQGVNDIVFSNDGTRLYSASTDGTIVVWDVAAGTELQRLASHGFGVNELILNEDDGWLAYGAADGSTRFIHPETGALIRDITLERRPILSLAYDPVHRNLAVGDGDGYIMVIDTTDMTIARDFRATEQGPIWALAFSQDGQNIHAGGLENIVYSWPVDTLTEHGQMGEHPRSFLEDPNTLENGERQFKRKCSICHTLSAGNVRRAGPTLYDLFGRQAGTVDEYRYSDTLVASDIIWSAETINALFDQGPDEYVPGSKMPMQRIAQQQDRNDLIDYLRRATAQGDD